MSRTDDIKKLIEIASQENFTWDGEEVQLGEVYKFILDKEIGSGECRVPVAAIYELYRDWKTRGPLMDRRHFFRQFKKHFEFKRDGKGRYYMLDPEPFDLTKEGLEREKFYLNKEREMRGSGTSVKEKEKNSKK